MKTREIISQFRSYKDWYRRDFETIQALYPEHADLFAGLLSATSPRVSMKRSYKMARRIMADLEHGGPIRFDGLMPCHIPNIKRVLSGRPLKGPKVSAFYENLTGNYKAVTIDSWMVRYLTRGKKSTCTPKEYMKYSAKIRRLAKSYNVEPAELQAMLWIYYRTTKGYKPVSYTSVGQNDKQLKFWRD
jgi:hypothetical protein